jgi:hypothetical protein
VRLSHRNNNQRRLWRLLLATALTGFVIMVGAPTATAADGWIDGGDDLPCVDDETCLWIEGCVLDGDNNPVYPNHNGTFVGGGAHGYKGDTPTASPTPPPSTAPASPTTKPTTSPTTKPTTKPSTKPSSKPTTPTSKPTKPSSGASSTGGSAASPGATASDDPSAEASESESAEADSAVLRAPRLTVDGSNLTVHWKAPGGDRTVTGYTVTLVGGPSADVDAETTEHTFTELADGPYRAQVVAQYADGVPETSPVSERTSIGENPRKVLGTVSVTGDVVAGGTVTVTGAGFAGDVSGFGVEIHSDPIVLASVATDAEGGFALEATVPDTLEPGDHSIVVVYDGVEVASTPVTVSAPAPAPAAAASTPTAGESAPTTQGGVILLLGLAGVGVAALVGHEVTKRRRSGRPVTSPIAAGAGPEEATPLTA